MKRVLCFILAVLVVFSLSACGEKKTSDNNKSDDSKKQENNAESISGNNDNTGGSNENKEDDLEISFSEVVVVDNTECLIKITEIDPNNMWGFTLKAQLENKSTTKNYMFSVETASINGVECDPYFAAKVAAGKKANEEISFSDEIEEYGIGAYTDIELFFRVYDSDDWSADAVAETSIHIYPYGVDKAAKFVRETKPTDNVLVDNEYVTVIVTGYEDDEIWGYTANLYYINKTNKNLMISADDVSVNGYMADPFYAQVVSAGKCAFGSMSWDDTTLEDNGIVDIEKIEFKLRVYDDDDWSGDDFVNKTVTLNP